MSRIILCKYAICDFSVYWRICCPYIYGLVFSECAGFFFIILLDSEDKFSFSCWILLEFVVGQMGAWIELSVFWLSLCSVFFCVISDLKTNCLFLLSPLHSGSIWHNRLYCLRFIEVSFTRTLMTNMTERNTIVICRHQRRRSQAVCQSLSRRCCHGTVFRSGHRRPGPSTINSRRLEAHRTSSLLRFRMPATADSQRWTLTGRSGHRPKTSRRPRTGRRPRPVISMLRGWPN